MESLDSSVLLRVPFKLVVEPFLRQKQKQRTRKSIDSPLDLRVYEMGRHYRTRVGGFMTIFIEFIYLFHPHVGRHDLILQIL